MKNEHMGKAVDHAEGQIRFLQRNLAAAIGLLRGNDATREEIADLAGVFEWKVIDSGGNTKPGVFGNHGSCPCERGYTVNTVQTPVAAWPNPALVNNCASNPPAADAPEWECAEDCVQVMTNIWSGWDVVQNTKTGQIIFNCCTFAQYHCKKPNDPDRNKPPRATDPGDTTPEL